jgi:hypothetical protein
VTPCERRTCDGESSASPQREASKFRRVLGRPSRGAGSSKMDEIVQSKSALNRCQPRAKFGVSP